MYLFDLDGTLINSNGIWKEVDRTFLSRRGIPYTHAYYEGVAHTILPRAAEFTKQFCGLSESCEEIIAEWMELAKGLYRTVELKPGVRACLERYQAEGRRMAIVTSSVPEHCGDALRHLRLEHFFERVIFAQELGMDKQTPDLWRTVAASLDVRPDECTLFDDSFASCRGARAAGIRVVGVYDLYFAENETEMRGFCDRYIKSFTELFAAPGTDALNAPEMNRPAVPGKETP